MRVIRGILTDAEMVTGSIVRCTVAGVTGETIEDAEMIQEFGHSSLPEDGTECIAIQSGHRTFVIAGVDRASYPEMNSGDIAVHTDPDQYMIVKKSGGIDIRTSGTVTVYAQTVRLCEGDLPTPPLIPVTDGVVTPQCVCSYSGMHAQGSASVLAKT